MKNMTIEMPIVQSCDAHLCGYNVKSLCHAKAITIGDGDRPGCDTFFEDNKHSKEKKRMAGVGACKVSLCKHNNDFECFAENIEVGNTNHSINCLTFVSRNE